MPLNDHVAVVVVVVVKINVFIKLTEHEAIARVLQFRRHCVILILIVVDLLFF